MDRYLLLDTCAISEYSQKSPDENVLAFLESLDPADTFISAVTVGEIFLGIELLGPSRKRRNLEIWFRDSVLTGFRDQIIAYDEDIGQLWGVLGAKLLQTGHRMGYADSLIAATALSRGLRVVTRNEADFSHCGVKIVNPWK